MVPKVKYLVAFILKEERTKYNAYKLMKYYTGMMLSIFLKLLKLLGD